jgi:hypothetical protein
MPLPVPNECWEMVGLDFATGLPVSKGSDANMTCVDRLSKRPKYVLLGTIEFAHATLVNSFTKLTPFEVDAGRLPRSLIESAKSCNQYAANFASDRNKIVEQAQANVKDAQDRMKPCYDRARSNVKFVEGDMVYLSIRNLPLTHAVQGMQLDREKLPARYT